MDELIFKKNQFKGLIQSNSISHKINSPTQFNLQNTQLNNALKCFLQQPQIYITRIIVYHFFLYHQHYIAILQSHFSR